VAEARATAAEQAKVTAAFQCLQAVRHWPRAVRQSLGVNRTRRFEQHLTQSLVVQGLANELDQRRALGLGQGLHQ